MAEGGRKKGETSGVEADRGLCVVCASVWWFSVGDASRPERKIGFAGSGVPRYLSQSTPRFVFFFFSSLGASSRPRYCMLPISTAYLNFFQVIFFFLRRCYSNSRPRLPSLVHYLLLARQPEGGQMIGRMGRCGEAAAAASVLAASQQATTKFFWRDTGGKGVSLLGSFFFLFLLFLFHLHIDVSMMRSIFSTLSRLV